MFCLHYHVRLAILYLLLVMEYVYIQMWTVYIIVEVF